VTHSGSASHSGTDNHIGMNFIGDLLGLSDWLVGTVPQDDRPSDWIDIDMNDISTSHRHTKVRHIAEHRKIDLMSMFLYQTQNDYIRDFIPRRHHYLNILLHGEARKDNGMCHKCVTDEATWRCLECFGQMSYCTACFSDMHDRLPFHHVEKWSGSFFQPSWLRVTGVSIALGHSGDVCPLAMRNHGHWEDDRHNNGNTDGQYDPMVDEDHQFLPGDPYPKAGDFDMNGRPILVIVDVSGVHHLGVEFCRCQNALSHEEQLMALGLFPATFDHPQMAFTFNVLDNFLLDNLECKTTASNYYSKLRRLTNSSFPQLVPVGNQF